MAPYCCVVGCFYSTYRNERDSSVSFHCVPAKTNLRTLWLQVLTKYNPAFKPNDFSTVCSVHFTPANFKQNAKKRILQPNAVPSIFPRYPKSVDNLFKQHRPVRNTNALIEGKSSSEITSNTIEKSCCPENDSNGNFCKDGFSEPAYGHQRNVGIQVSSLPTGHLQMLKKENSILRSQNYKLKEHLKTVTEKICNSKLKFESSTEYHKIKKIKETLHPNDFKAKFLIDQINNFDKHQPHWSDSTLQVCLDWRSEASKSYDYARNIELISLPSRCTLERHMKYKYPAGKHNQETEQIVHTIIINEPPFGKVINQPVLPQLIKNTPKLYTSRNINIPSYETVSEGLLHAFVIQNIPQKTCLDGGSNNQDVVMNPVNLIDLDISVPCMNNPLEGMRLSETSFETIIAENDSIDDITHIEITSSIFTDQL